MKKIIIACAAVILLGWFLSTFIEENKTNNNDNSKSILMSVESLNYNFGNIKQLSKDDENIICATCRGLVKLTNSNEVVLDLAKDLEVSSDGIEYKFILKDDARWSNGEKIKSEEIIMYFKSIIQSEDSEDIKALLSVYGVDKFRQEKVDFEKYVAMTSEGDIIKIRLNKRDDNFLYELSKPQYRVKRNSYLWKDIKSNYNRITYSGEYSISNVKEEYIELKNNFNTEEENIIMIKDENKENSMASYEVGDRDIVVDIPISQVSRLDKSKRILYSSSGEGIYISFNSEKLNMDLRKKLAKILYNASEQYYDKNQKAIKFSEGSYFEKEMDKLDKLQSRKVSINNSKECSLPPTIKVLLGKDDVSEDFVRFLVNYFKDNLEINIIFSDEEEDEESEFHMALLRLYEDERKKDNLFENIKKTFSKENSMYFSGTSNVEDKIFNDYIILPVMFINRSIAVSDKVNNIRIDGNGNVDFSGIN